MYEVSALLFLQCSNETSRAAGGDSKQIWTVEGAHFLTFELKCKGNKKCSDTHVISGDWPKKFNCNLLYMNKCSVVIYSVNQIFF